MVSSDRFKCGSFQVDISKSLVMKFKMPYKKQLVVFIPKEDLKMLKSLMPNICALL